MKKGFYMVATLLVIALLSACNSAEDNKSVEKVDPELVTNPISASDQGKKSDLPEMTFESKKHDFGLLVQGEKVSHTFKFTNTGGSDLVISDASSTCGCTVPSFEKEPIKPGEEGEIEVQFSSAGRKGSVHKTVNILTNAQPNTIKLEIEAEIFVNSTN